MYRDARIGSILTLIVILAGASGPLAAQSYPNRPIRIVVPYPPGGGADILARAVGQKLTEAWGQQLVVDNRPGGGANIGAELAARATPDGYTLFQAALAHSVNVSLYSKLHYDVVRDFAPVIFVATVPGVLVVHPSVAAQTTREFIEYAKTRPGQLNYASTGSGGPQHLGMELFKVLSGVELTHIPYKGAAPALTDLVSGQAHSMLGNMISTLPHIRSGKLRALAVTSAKRSQAVPDLPTIAESGVPGFESGSWFGIMAPAGTPRAIIDKVNAEVNRILALPEMGKRLGASGAVLTGGSAETFAGFLRAEIDKWAKVVKFAKMRVE
jgi:tripartite-type tricarboxylate transporter receptor subunit TctC